MYGHVFAIEIIVIESIHRITDVQSGSVKVHVFYFPNGCGDLKKRIDESIIRQEHGTISITDEILPVTELEIEVFGG